MSRERPTQLLAKVVGAALLLCGLLPSSSSAQPVAIVTDIAGKGTLAEPGQTIGILTEIQSGSRVRLESGARMVALYLRSGAEYTFTGPSQIEFQQPGPIMQNGPPPQRRVSTLGANVAIKPVGVTQAAFVMRSGGASSRVRLLSLSATKTLESRPEFRWQRIDGAKGYRFELTDGSGRMLVESDTDATSYRLPASIVLEEGTTYTWEVSARSADGRRYVSAGDFTLADSSLRREVEKLRPRTDATFSERVAFAVWLDSMELKDEARKYWRVLAEERPAEAKLKTLALE